MAKSSSSKVFYRLMWVLVSALMLAPVFSLFMLFGGTLISLVITLVVVGAVSLLTVLAMNRWVPAKNK